MTVREIQGFLLEQYGTEVIKTRGHFPTDEAATKLIWLALRRIGIVQLMTGRPP